jgi:hypothetical protein
MDDRIEPTELVPKCDGSLSNEALFGVYVPIYHEFAESYEVPVSSIFGMP